MLLGADTGPHAFVDDLEHPDLDEVDRHHLARVLRVRDGDPLTVSDGRGGWRPCRWGASLEPTGAVVHVPAPVRPITIGFALVKGERPELVVQKLTELGVDHIVPFTAERSVVRWDAARAGKHLERLRRVAREAAMQSRRCYLPEVEALATFDEVVARAGMAVTDRGGTGPTAAMSGALIGPEGGWTAAERSRARAAGAPVLGLADQVLRAETAAFTAAALLGALRAGLVAPGPTREVAN